MTAFHRVRGGEASLLGERVRPCIARTSSMHPSHCLLVHCLSFAAALAFAALSDGRSCDHCVTFAIQVATMGAPMRRQCREHAVVSPRGVIAVMAPLLQQQLLPCVNQTCTQRQRQSVPLCQLHSPHTPLAHPAPSPLFHRSQRTPVSPRPPNSNRLPLLERSRTDPRESISAHGTARTRHFTRQTSCH